MPLSVRRKVGEQDPPVRADHPKWQCARFEQRYQMRSRDVQEIRSLLRRQLRMDGYDRDRIAVRHLAENFEEQIERSTRHSHSCVLAAVNLESDVTICSCSESRQATVGLLRLLGYLLCRKFGEGWHGDHDMHQTKQAQ